jgi:signal transduction histidine kinase
MTLRLRFLLSLLAVTAIMAVPAVYGVSRVGEVRDIALDLREQAATSALGIGRLSTALEQLDRFQRLYVATTDPEYSDLMWSRLRVVRAELNALEEGGYGGAVAAAGVPTARLVDVTERLDALVSGGLLAAATVYREIAAEPLLAEAVNSVPQLAQAMDDHTAARVAAAERSANAATTAVTTAVIISLFLAATLAVAAAGVLSSPLSRLATAMARVADGVFDAPRNLPYDRSDELGDLARSFRAMTLRLAHLDRMKAEFIGVATHGLKTPIGVIGGYAELIREEADDTLTTRHRELLGALSEQADLLRRRLDQLIEISRMEAGSLTLGLEEIYLRHFVAALEREYTPVAEQRGIAFDIRLDERTPPFIVADPDVLRVDVFTHLIGDALRLTPRGGNVEVVVRPDADLIVFEITDSGPSIPPDQIAQIFEKHHHGRDPATSGLGPAIARAAVLAHNGRIDVHNLPGRGVRFRVALPSHQASALGVETVSAGGTA